MTDLEISKALALAIGYAEADMQVSSYGSFSVQRHLSFDSIKYSEWEFFDYRDWNVIGPIAARFDCFPSQGVWGAWHASYHQCAGSVAADTPQKAVALAVIGAKK